LIVLEGDTFVTITPEQFSTILFSFSYIRSLESTNNIASKQLSRKDSIITYLNIQMTLERKKQKEQVEIADNLEQIITDHKKQKKKDKLKNVLINIGLGAVAVGESVLIVNLLLR